MHDLTKHSQFLITAFIITSALNYAFGVALSWLFTPAQFGVLGVAQSLLLLTALVVGSGFAWTATGDLAASGVTSETRRRFRAAWAANVVLGALLAGGLWAAYAAGWLPLGSAYRAVVPLVGLTTVLLAARSVVNGAARGLYRFGPVAVNLAGEVAVKVVAGLALVAIGGGVVGVMVGFALGAAAALAHSLWIVRPARLWHGRGWPREVEGSNSTSLPTPLISRGWFDRGVMAATAPLFVGMLGPALMLNLDILGLRLLAPAGQGDELAGFYQAAVILARAPVFVARSLTLVLFSYAAGAKAPASGERRGASGHVWAAMRAWVRLLLPVGLVLILAPQAALTLFFPTRYRAAAPSLRLAAGGGLLLALVTLLNGVFQARGHRRRPAWAAGLALFAQVVILAWLAPRRGASGAALSLLGAGSVALLGLLPGIVPLLRASAPSPLSPSSRSGRGAAEGQRPESVACTEPSAVLSLSKGRSEGLLRFSAPLLVLVAPLLLLPDGGRNAVLLKLTLSGLGYLAALGGLHFRSAGGPDRSATNPFIRLVLVLMGG